MPWGSEVSGRAEVGIYTCNLCAVLKSCVDYVNKRRMLLLRIMESLEAFIQTGSKHTAINNPSHWSKLHYTVLLTSECVFCCEFKHPVHSDPDRNSFRSSNTELKHCVSYRSIHLSIHPSIHPSIDLCIHPSIYQSFLPSTHSSIYPPSIHLSIYLPIYQSTQWWNILFIPCKTFEEVTLHVCVSCSVWKLGSFEGLLAYVTALMNREYRKE